MATDDTKGNGTAAFGGSGSVLAAAWSEFVARALQAGGRKSADAIAQALQPAPAPGEAPGSIENLVALYREYLGDMANMLPSIARYLSGHAKPVAGRASRLLMRIRTTDELVQKVYTLSAKSVAYPRADQGAFLFFTVPAVMDPLKNALEAIPGNDSSAGNLLLALNEELNRIENLNVPAKLDEIKYEFRRH